jgi:hypothetical protein
MSQKSDATESSFHSAVDADNADPQFEGLSTGEAAFMKFCLKIEDRFTKLESRIESKFEAKSLSDYSNLKSPEFAFDPRAQRQSLGSFQSSATFSPHQLTVNKNPFRLEKPKFEIPKDALIDGALDEAVLKFFDDCARHVEAWKAMAENRDKPFEGEHNFALISLPPDIQRQVAHSMDLIYSVAEVVMWTPDEVQRASYWTSARTADVRKIIVTRRAQGISFAAAIKTIYPPVLAFPKGVGLIHLEAFDLYKDKLITQVARLAEGGIVLPLVEVKDAIISAIPDAKFKGELYSFFGHAKSLPGPTSSGDVRTFSIKQMFEYIRQHIITIKKKDLADIVNKDAVTRGMASQPSQNFRGGRAFAGPPRSRVQAIDFQPASFVESDESFWSAKENEHQLSDGGDEFHQVNAMVQKAKSKECHHKGIGPDGKLLCPYLGNPDTANCGFIHPAKELELKGRGVSKSTPVKPNTVHNISSGLGIDYAHESDFQDDGVGDL